MKMVPCFLVMFLMVFCLGAKAEASEFGFFFGGYSKDSDIDGIESLVSPGTWLNVGERSTATHFGLGYTHRFFVPSLEMEHTLGFATGADQSAKPNVFLYSANVNFVLPVGLMRVKPFIGAGMGYVYYFGETPEWIDIAGFLGNKGYFQVNLGGGVKIKVSERWRLRLTLRDYILPNFEKVIKSEDPQQPDESLYRIINEGSHNLSFTMGIFYHFSKRRYK